MNKKKLKQETEERLATHKAFFILFVGLIALFGFAYMHELVHVEIFRSYGIESRIEMFSRFPDAVTIAEKPCPVNECTLAHNINEVVGYPLFIILAYLIIVGFIKELK